MGEEIKTFDSERRNECVKEVEEEIIKFLNRLDWGKEDGNTPLVSSDLNGLRHVVENGFHYSSPVLKPEEVIELAVTAINEAEESAVKNYPDREKTIRSKMERLRGWVQTGSATPQEPDHK